MAEDTSATLGGLGHSRPRIPYINISYHQAPDLEVVEVVIIGYSCPSCSVESIFT